jgi:hypothetical protein
VLNKQIERLWKEIEQKDRLVSEAQSRQSPDEGGLDGTGLDLQGDQLL